MPIMGSVPVSGFVAPTSETDIYPSHDSTYGKGGWREVADVLERDAITAERRTEGMAVYVKDTDTVYILKDGIENTDWVIFTSGSSSSNSISEASDVVLTALANGNTLVWDETAGKWVNGTISGSGGTYSTPKPVVTAIGGIEAGTEYVNEDIAKVINDLLFPYEYPAFTAFTVDGASSGSYEVGYTYAGGTKTFAWSISNSWNVKENSVVLNSVNGLANDGTEEQVVADITKTTVGSHTFSISATNTKEQVFSRNIVLNWGLKRFWGASASTSLGDAEILTMSQEIATSRVKTVTYDCSGGKYFYFAYPTSFGDLSNTKINNLSWNDWVLVKRDFVNQYGVTIPMNIYRSFNLLNGTITVVWG